MDTVSGEGEPFSLIWDAVNRYLPPEDKVKLISELLLKAKAESSVFDALKAREKENPAAFMHAFSVMKLAKGASKI